MGGLEAKYMMQLPSPGLPPKAVQFLRQYATFDDVLPLPLALSRCHRLDETENPLSGHRIIKFRVEDLFRQPQT